MCLSSFIFSVFVSDVFSKEKFNVVLMIDSKEQSLIYPNMKEIPIIVNNFCKNLCK